MKHKTKSVTQPPDYDLRGVGEWIASLVVWYARDVSRDCVRLTQSGRVAWSGECTI